MLELTVFINVNIDNLKALSRFMPEIVNNDDKTKSESTKIRTEMKYLLISLVSSFDCENSSLLI